MEKINLYFSLEQSTLVPERKVHIGDIATIFCLDKDISCDVEKTLITTLSNTPKDQTVISALKIIQIIQLRHKNVQVFSIGSNETIVYYQNLNLKKAHTSKLKSLLLLVIAFFGTAYSVMSYHGDVGSIDLINNLYVLFTANSKLALKNGPLFGIIAFSVGLFIGMLIFFNHGIKIKNVDDPTPLQVQLRLYEKDVNECIIVNSSRKGKSIDVD